MGPTRLDARIERGAGDVVWVMLNPLRSRTTETRRARSLLPLALVLALVLGGGSWLAAHRRAMSLEGAGLSIAPEQLDLGRVPAQSDFRWKLTFVNSSNQEINVEQLLASCRCTSVEPPSFVVPPRQSTDVVVTLNLLGQVDVTSLDPESFEAEIVAVVASALNQPDPWRISGTIWKPLAISTANVRFGTVGPGSEKQATRSVAISSYERLRTIQVNCDSGSVAAELRPGSIPEQTSVVRSTFELIVRVQPDGPLGSFAFPIGLQAVRTDGQCFASIPLNVTGTLVHDVQASPAELRLGARSPGDRVIWELRLRSGPAHQSLDVSA